jgi:hypothetical protein
MKKFFSFKFLVLGFKLAVIELFSYSVVSFIRLRSTLAQMTGPRQIYKGFAALRLTTSGFLSYDNSSSVFSRQPVNPLATI